LSRITSSPDRREITWVDAETCGGPEWLSVEDMCEFARKPLPQMRTMGYVVYETDLYIAVTDSFGTGETSAVTKIPKALITQDLRLTGVITNEGTN
jgi:hypothetical protein